MSTPSFGVVANVLSDRALRTGAKVWILYCSGDAEHPIVVGLSKSGRTIRKHIAYKRLTNFRAAWVPPSMRSHVAWQYDTKAAATKRAQGIAEMWSGVRYFNRDGTQQMQDGISVDAAFARARAAHAPEIQA